MLSIGETIRSLREAKRLLLRHVGAEIDIDPTLLSKIERGDRLPTKEQIKKFAKFFNTPLSDLMTKWLSEKLFQELKNEEFAYPAIIETQKKLKLETYEGKN